MNEQITITGIAESITFRNEENGYTVLDFSSGGELFTACGNLAGGIFPGEKLTFTGRWVVHPTFGKQLVIESCAREVPETAADILAYLSSGIIKGIKEKTAQKIISKFGSDTFEILENHPERLAEINGISYERAKEISKEFTKKSDERKTLIALEKYGISANESFRIFQVFGTRSIETVEKNPYLLCGERINISFDRACDIADRLPNKPEEQYRIAAGILYVIRHNSFNGGHTCLPRKKLFAPCCSLLDCSEDSVDIQIDELVSQKQLVSETVNGSEYIFLPELHKAEKNIASTIMFMKHFAPKVFCNIDDQISKAELISGVCYNENQRLAIRLAVEKGILVLTGGPGTGKTTTLRGILKVFESEGIEVQLAAPTGRAVKRMSELTGREAKTIHRLLEAEWDKNDRTVFQRNKRNPISAGAVIIDELSMVDVNLFSSLLDALPLGCRLVMVGDSDQLPPVGAGNVLHDLIDSKQLPVVELKEIFRQAMESLIITNAHSIVKGEMPVLDRKDKDFFFMSRPEPHNAAKTVCELCVTRLPAAYKFSPVEDIQVLCPSRKGETGNVNLNKILQSQLNPPMRYKREHTFGQRILREGDKLMQTKNNYNIPWKNTEKEGLGVFNGEIGFLDDISEADRTVKVRFDDKVAEYPFESCSELEHAYAVTVHKSQGSEFDAVVMPVTGVIDKLSYRNLLYTAVTRAKKLMILVGSPNVVEKMVNNASQTKRYSALKSFIMSEEDK